MDVMRYLINVFMFAIVLSLAACGCENSLIGKDCPLVNSVNEDIPSYIGEGVLADKVSYIKENQINKIDSVKYINETQLSFSAVKDLEALKKTNVNDIVMLPAIDGTLPFGYIGRVSAITSGSEKNTYILNHVSIEDAYKKFTLDLDTSLTNTKIDKLYILPNVQSEIFSNTAIVDKPQYLIKNHLVINYPIPLKNGSNAVIFGDIDLSELKVKAKADYDNSREQNWANFTTKISGNISADIKFKASNLADEEIPISTIHEMIDWNSFPNSSNSFWTPIAPNNAMSQEGKFPIASLIVKSLAVSKIYTSSGEVASVKQPVGVIISIYMDMNGKLSINGEVGLKLTEFKFDQGFISNIVNQKLELDAVSVWQNKQFQFPSVKGALNSKQHLSLDIQSKLFAGGINASQVNLLMGGDMEALMNAHADYVVSPVGDEGWLGDQCSVLGVVAEINSYNAVRVNAVSNWLSNNNQYVFYDNKKIHQKDIHDPKCTISKSLDFLTSFKQSLSDVNKVDVTIDFSDAVIANKNNNNLVEQWVLYVDGQQFSIPSDTDGKYLFVVGIDKKYDIKLQGLNHQYGVIKEASQELNVPSAPIVAIDAASMNDNCKNILFTANASTFTGSHIESYDWSFERQGEPLQHIASISGLNHDERSMVFQTCGDIKVMLTVVDSKGFKTQTSRVINSRVLAPEITEVKLSVDKAIIGQNITISLVGQRMNSGVKVVFDGCQAQRVAGYDELQQQFICMPTIVGKDIVGYIKSAQGTELSRFHITVSPPKTPVATGLLNDTGIAFCSNDTNSWFLDCQNVLNSDWVALNQDALQGRDGQAKQGKLKKIGAGVAGFDFTKIGANGESLPANASQWRCVLDNHTGLMWEVKTQDGGIHDWGIKYTWYNPDDNINGGFSGDENNGVNTYAFANAVNEQGLCGYTDWRMPTRSELVSIVYYGRQGQGPVIDSNYFPNTKDKIHWTASPSFDSNNAWFVYFDYELGDPAYANKHYLYYARLVRSGQ